MLLNALLTTCVSSFEVLIAAVFRGHARLHPESMGQEQVLFSDLLALSSISEVVDQTLARKVDEFLRRSFAGQKKWFQEALHVDFESLCIDWPQTSEVFERRHTLVHHDGKASQQYVDRVDPGVAVGTRLEVDDQYVIGALNRLLVLGILVGARSWIKLVPDEKEDAERLLHDEMYDSMLEGRWPVVEAICRSAIDLATEQSKALVFKANLWLALKRMHGLEPIRSEVEAWDVSALSQRYQLGKAALLDDLELAADLVQDLLAHEKLSPSELREWPVLEELRGSERYMALEELAGPLEPDGEAEDSEMPLAQPGD
jgi:hypothetical protein